MNAQTATRYIGFRLQEERDEDILSWWETIPAGERSHILRSLIRAYLTSGEIASVPTRDASLGFTSSLQLAQVQADTAWIKSTLTEIPAYLERLIGGIRVVQSPAHSDHQPHRGEDLTEDAAKQRATHIAKRSW